jgi:antitoxin (DNA-binding transcriptional repressor) of toxin-antitoxin stability system
LAPGEEVVLTRGDKPVTTIRAVPPATREAPKLGTLEGMVLSMEHFDDPLEEFEEYTG